MSEYKEIDFGNYKISLGGTSHIGIDKNKNQDSYLFEILPENECTYLIVADGLGSCSKSDEGSKKICEIIRAWINEELFKYERLSDSVANIFKKHVIEAWKDAYSMDEISQYDTTMHTALWYKNELLVGGIGDGMLLVRSGEILAKDYIDSEKFFSNITNSMCSIDVYEQMNFEVLSKELTDGDSMVIMATDGIADDLVPEKKLSLLDYFQETIKTSGVENLHKELVEWIDEWDTDGHSDDKTIAYMLVQRDAK